MWGDCDPAGWLYYPSVQRYFEQAETALLVTAGIRYVEELKAGRGYPRVNVHADYKRPLGVDDRGICHAVVARVGRTSISLGFTMVKDGEEETAVSGGITMVVMDWEARRPIEVPARLRRALDSGN